MHAAGLVALLLSAPPLSGQRVEPSALAGELRRAPSGGRVRVGVFHERWEAQVVRVRGDTVTLRVGETNRTLALTAIDTLWVRQPSTRRGAVTGGVIGGLLGVGIGALFGSLCDGTACGREIATWTIGTGAIIGGTGAIVGATIGRFMTHWGRAYP